MMFEDYGPRDRSLRAADADREAMAESLREQHLAGRLDTDELQERIERCYDARTYADLDAVFVDLPRPQPRTSPRGNAFPWPRVALFPLMPLLIVALVLSHGHLLWLAVPLLFWFVARPLRWRAGGVM
ncbi:MAG: DUF1707 domain-containing protein [Solirubrobacterales bacterium]|nr:DUF1707 domain-containing protein [Solirubrobacterales bacterium]